MAILVVYAFFAAVFGVLLWVTLPNLLKELEELGRKRLPAKQFTWKSWARTPWVF